MIWNLACPIFNSCPYSSAPPTLCRHFLIQEVSLLFKDMCLIFQKSDPSNLYPLSKSDLTPQSSLLKKYWGWKSYPNLTKKVPWKEMILLSLPTFHPLPRPDLTYLSIQSTIPYFSICLNMTCAIPFYSICLNMTCDIPHVCLNMTCTLPSQVPQLPWMSLPETWLRFTILLPLYDLRYTILFHVP